MNLSLHPAQPSHVNAAVPLIYSSGPAAFDFVFRTEKQTAHDFLRKAFLDGAGEFGFRNHTVALVDGAVVGIGAGFSGETGLRFSVAAARQILSLYGVQALGIIRCGLQIEHLFPPPDKTTLYIAHLGVASAMQSQGIGALFIEHFMAQGKAKGCTLAALDVSVENPRAQALYERAGFVVMVERESHLEKEFAQVANHRRMEKQIPL